MALAGAPRIAKCEQNVCRRIESLKRSLQTRGHFADRLWQHQCNQLIADARPVSNRAGCDLLVGCSANDNQQREDVSPDSRQSIQ